MSFLEKLSSVKKRSARFLLNDVPTRLVSSAYDSYSRRYQGQLSLGLPVSRQLLLSNEQIRDRAAGKLALSLYHLFLRTTGKRIPRKEIKRVLVEELESNRIRLTEDVIVLSKADMKLLALERFRLNRKKMPSILAEANRRMILKEALSRRETPAYFESEIEEKEANSRGDYETVYYREYTGEGREIGFRRLVSMEQVTAGDNRPSVVLVPGFANNSNCYDLNNRYSIAKDLADLGNWVYLFDPRGMGINEGKFDPVYTIDTLIDYDLSAVVRFIFNRTRCKPSFLAGHSMGGIVSENMVLSWGLRQNLNRLNGMEKHAREALKNVLPSREEAVRNIEMIKGIITLGSPKFFQKMSHLAFPVGLWLNHMARIFQLRYVPIQEVFWSLTQPPIFKHISNYFLNRNIGELNFLTNPDNHQDDKLFAQRFLFHAMESVPLGMGFQLLKAIYNGEGFKRMDESRLNYSEQLAWFPKDVPVFHFWSTTDPIASPANIRYSERYPHTYKRVYYIESEADLKKVEILPERSQLVDFVISDVQHIDFLYGRRAEKVVFPLVHKIIHQVWDGWDYKGEETHAA